MELTDKLVLALPKGRILEEVMPLVKADMRQRIDGVAETDA